MAQGPLSAASASYFGAGGSHAERLVGLRVLVVPVRLIIEPPVLGEAVAEPVRHAIAQPVGHAIAQTIGHGGQSGDAGQARELGDRVPRGDGKSRPRDDRSRCGQALAGLASSRAASTAAAATLLRSIPIRVRP
jgi:hypothetical protein